MKRALPLMLLLACGSPTLDDSDLCDACARECTVDMPAITSAAHVTDPVDYSDPPPAGGDHDGCWAPFGVHEDPLAPENWVHNLEHGAVVYLHDCLPGCADDLAAIEAMTATLTEGTWLITPYEGLTTRFAAISWGVRMQTDCGSTDLMRDFYETHVANAPEEVLSGPPEACM